MIFNISIACVDQCNSSVSKTIQYGQIKINNLEAFATIGDFVLYHDVVERQALGQLLDVYILGDISVAELSTSVMESNDGSQFFVLINPSHPGFHCLEHLGGTEESVEIWTTS